VKGFPCARGARELAPPTRIELESNCGIDTSLFAQDWRGVSIITEIVLADFLEARSRWPATREPWDQAGLFAA
jgi:hypothetical protein